jgi:tRNA G18 (ribose-2'-O)-methylase SpoU
MSYDPLHPFAMWSRNVIDEFKSIPDEEIKEKLVERSNGFAVLMTHVEGDFNIGTVIRSANFHGAMEFFYYGKKKMDRRGCVGVYKYTPVNYLEGYDDLLKLKERYTFVGFENNVPGTVPLYEFDWNLSKPPCVVVGEECNGIHEEVMKLCDVLVEIPNYGSIRSLNVGTAASIAMYDYVSKKKMRAA